MRLTGFAPRTVQQEVNRLVGAELLGERRHGNRRYVGANRHHPLFHAVREIVVKTEGIAPVLREALGTDGIEFAFVFGATAAREPAASSPVDVLIVGTAGAGEIERRLIPAPMRWEGRSNRWLDPGGVRAAPGRDGPVSRRSAQGAEALPAEGRAAARLTVPEARGPTRRSVPGPARPVGAPAAFGIEGASVHPPS